MIHEPPSSTRALRIRSIITKKSVSHSIICKSDTVSRGKSVTTTKDAKIRCSPDNTLAARPSEWTRLDSCGISSWVLYQKLSGRRGEDPRRWAKRGQPSRYERQSQDENHFFSHWVVNYLVTHFYLFDTSLGQFPLQADRIRQVVFRNAFAMAILLVSGEPVQSEIQILPWQQSV